MKATVVNRISDGLLLWTIIWITKISFLQAICWPSSLGFESVLRICLALHAYQVCTCVSAYL
jgi:hypothetical protein